MGKFSSNNNNVYQQLSGALPGGVWAMPAYFNNTIYYGSVGSPILAFTITNARLSTVATARTPAIVLDIPERRPAISANGSSNGIVWASENSSPAVLHAYNASNLANELYNSNQASGGRDQFGAGNKYITPMIVNGKVFVGTDQRRGGVWAAAVVAIRGHTRAIKFVILSEVVVRNANDNTVEGPLYPDNTTAAKVSCRSDGYWEESPAVQTAGERVGVLRLRGCFASRTSHSAQDDKLNKLTG